LIAQLICHLSKAYLLIDPWTVCRAFKTCIDKLKIEHCNPRLAGTGSGGKHPKQQSCCDFPGQTHDRVSCLYVLQ
jgi:hypothetical protein